MINCFKYDICDQALEEKDKKQNGTVDHLSVEQQRLKRKLEGLRTMAYRNSRSGRSLSECSSSTVSTASSASISNDEHGNYHYLLHIPLISTTSTLTVIFGPPRATSTSTKCIII